MKHFQAEESGIGFFLAHPEQKFPSWERAKKRTARVVFVLSKGLDLNE